MRVTEGGVHGVGEEPSESDHVAYTGEALHTPGSMRPNADRRKKKYFFFNFRAIGDFERVNIAAY